MRAIGDIIREQLPDASGALAVRDQRQLPSADALAPDKATAVGSRLLSGGQLQAAIPYLMRGAQAPNNAFGWRRLGALCHDLGYPEFAVRCYDRSLEMQPRQRFGLLGVAKALSDWPDATLEDLIGAATDLVPLLRDPEPAPVAYLLCRVARVISQRYPHPLIGQLVEDLRVLARQLDVRTDRERLAAVERRLEAVLHAAELVGGGATKRSAARRSIDGPPARPQLPRAS